MSSHPLFTHHSSRSIFLPSLPFFDSLCLTFLPIPSYPFTSLPFPSRPLCRLHNRSLPTSSQSFSAVSLPFSSFPTKASFYPIPSLLVSFLTSVLFPPCQSLILSHPFPSRSFPHVRSPVRLVGRRKRSTGCVLSLPSRARARGTRGSSPPGWSTRSPSTTRPPPQGKVKGTRLMAAERFGFSHVTKFMIECGKNGWM